MSALVPVCARLTAASASVDDHFAALYAWFGTANLTGLWTVDRAGNDTILLTQAVGNPLTRQLLITKGTNQINVQLDPLGEWVSAASPGTGSAARSDQRIGIPTSPVSGTYGDRSNIAIYPDAIAYLVQSNTNNFHPAGFHAGRLYVPYFADDGSIGISGDAVLAHQPRLTTGGNANAWSGSSSTNQSQIRVAATTWVSGIRSGSAQSNDGATVGGRLRMRPGEFMGGTSLTSGYMGYTRYLLMHDTNVSPLSIRPADTGNQGWLAIGFSTSATPLMMMWDRTVTP